MSKLVPWLFVLIPLTGLLAFAIWLHAVGAVIMIPGKNPIPIRELVQ